MTTLITENALFHTVHRLWMQNSLREARKFLATLETEEDYEKMIEEAYEHQMMHYAEFLKRRAHKKFNSLQTTLWQASVESNRRRLFKAEFLILNRSFVESLDNPVPHKLQVQTARLLARIYGSLMRFEEVEKQHELLERLGSLSPEMKVFYLINKMERGEAISLIEGLSEEERIEKQHRLYTILVSLYLDQGVPHKALALLHQLVDRYPESLVLRAERVAVLYLTQNYEMAIEEARHVNNLNPYHHMKLQYLMIEAHSLYQLDRLAELVQLVKMNAMYFKKHPYETLNPDAPSNGVLLDLRQPIQKVNYCVPASLSLILEAFGQYEEQETIARGVKEDQGTRLQHAREYMATRGMESLFFNGTVDLYKKLLDEGIPVLLSTFIEMSPHVQVLVGYDDRLQTLQIQDPNEVHPFSVRYDNLQEVYQLRNNLSIVFFPPEKAHIRAWFDLEEHESLEELHIPVEENEIHVQHVINYLEKYPNDTSAVVMGLLSLTEEVPKDVSANWLNQVEAAFGASHRDVKLLKGTFYYAQEQYEQAITTLRVPELKKDAYALRIIGLCYMKFDNMQYAYNAFENSVECDPYQPYIFNYLAYIDMRYSQDFQAYRWIQIAKRMLPGNKDTREVEAQVLLSSGAFKRAYHMYEDSFNENPTEYSYLYQMAKASLLLERPEEAERLYRKAIEINPNDPYPYTQLSGLPHFEMKQRNELLQQALTLFPNALEIYVELGALKTEQGNMEEAKRLFEHAATIDPEDGFIKFYIFRVLVWQSESEKALQLMEEILKSVEPKLLVEIIQFAQTSTIDLAIKKCVALHLEKWMQKLSSEDLDYWIEYYSDFSSEPAMAQQVMDTLLELSQRHKTSEMYKYLAANYEQMGIFHIAKKLYNQTKNNPNALYQLIKLDSWGPDGEAKYEEGLKRVILVHPYHKEGLSALIELYIEQEKYEAILQIAYFTYQTNYSIFPYNDIVFAAQKIGKLDELADFFDELKDQVHLNWWYTLKAAIAHGQGNMDRAEYFFSLARQEPNLYDGDHVCYSYIGYIQFLLETQRPHEALTHVKVQMANHPKDTHFTELFIMALHATKKIVWIESHIKELPKEQWSIHFFNVARELSKYALSQANDEGSKIDTIKVKTRQSFYRNRTIVLFKKAQTLDTENEGTVLALAEFYLNLSQPEKAEALLLPYAEDGHQGAVYMLMFTYAEKMKKKRTLKDSLAFDRWIVQSIHHSPTDMNLYGIWAEQLIDQENYQDAIEVLERGLAVNSYFVQFYNMTWNCLKSLHGNQATAHLQAFDKRIPPVVKEHEGFRLERAASFVDLEEWEFAFHLLDTFGEESIYYDSSLFERARIEAMQGNESGARDLLRKSLSYGDENLAVLAEKDKWLAGLVD